jgi:hypothetical protein
LWLLNDGHIYGYEDTYTPEILFKAISQAIEKGKSTGINQSKAIKDFLESDKKELKNIVYTLNPIPGKEDSDLTDAETVKALTEFYDNYRKSDAAAKEYTDTFWKNCGWRPSTFMRIRINGGTGVAEYYRDQKFTGTYTLRQTVTLFGK